jgi:hypothetical protein
MESPVIRPKLRQQNLFPFSGPLTSRLGAAFFRTVPDEPGVYFFYDDADRLLYIGQSGRLRHRIGSYRFVSETRHSRRTARLVSRAARIEWKICATAADAVALESQLLREYRPPFNRAGVWQGPSLWLTVEGGPGYFRACLLSEPGESGTGPLPSSFRSVFPSLMRCLYRWLHPEVSLWDFPPGMNAPRIPPVQAWAVSGDGGPAAESVIQLLRQGATDMIDALAVDFPDSPAPSMMDLFWREEVERLRKFAGTRER